MGLGDTFTDLAFSWGPDIQRAAEHMNKFYEDRAPLTPFQRAIMQGGLGAPSAPAAPEQQAPPATSEGLGTSPQPTFSGGTFGKMVQPMFPQVAMPDDELLAPVAWGGQPQAPQQSAPPQAQAAPASAPKSAADKIAALKPAGAGGSMRVSKKGAAMPGGLDLDKMTQQDWHALMQVMPLMQSQMKLEGAPDKFMLEQAKAIFAALRDEGNNAFKGAEGDKNRDLAREKLAEIGHYHQGMVDAAFARIRASMENVRTLVTGRANTAAIVNAVKAVDAESAVLRRAVGSAQAALAKIESDPVSMAKPESKAEIMRLRGQIDSWTNAAAALMDDPEYKQIRALMMRTAKDAQGGLQTRINEKQKVNAPVGMQPPPQNQSKPSAGPRVNGPPMGTVTTDYDPVADMTVYLDAAGKPLGHKRGR